MFYIYFQIEFNDQIVNTGIIATWKQCSALNAWRREGVSIVAALSNGLCTTNTVNTFRQW